MNRYAILTGKEPPPKKEPLLKKKSCPACKDDGYPCELCGRGAYKPCPACEGTGVTDTYRGPDYGYKCELCGGNGRVKISTPIQNRIGFYSLCTYTSQREFRRIGTIRSISISGPSSIETGVESRVHMTVEPEISGDFWREVPRDLWIYEDERPQCVISVENVSERSEDLLLDIEGYIV